MMFVKYEVSFFGTLFDEKAEADEGFYTDILDFFFVFKIILNIVLKFSTFSIKKLLIKSSKLKNITF